jgi:EAL domain-containing protein (putative c-di-GMP-specific phosphodiesterase class I)/GGDEF domain-containing protein
MSRKNTLRILVLNESDNESERLVSLFRSAGRVARLHRVRDLTDLQNQLTTAEWDVAIANNLHHEISPAQFIETIQSRQTDLPVVAICDDVPTELLDAGARDVIRRDDIDTRLVYAALREANSHEQARDLKRLQQELGAAEQRSALLLAESNDAIAYVAEGMIINANEMFANRFGYASASDLDCIAVVDLVNNSDHEKLKAMLKSIAGGGASIEFEFCGLCSSGDTFNANMELSSTTFDGEACIQLVIRDQARGITASANTENLGSFLSPGSFRDALATSITQAKHGGGGSCLLFIRIDNFQTLREKFGFCTARDILLSLGEFIKNHDASYSTICAYCDDGLSVLLKVDCETAKANVETLLQDIEQHIFDIHRQTQRITTSIAIIPVNAQSTEEVNDLLDLGYTTCEDLRNKDGVGNRCEISQPTKRKRAVNLSGNIKEALDAAMEDNRFFLSFQPVVSLRGGDGGDHYEVFLRMFNENEEELVADQFLEDMLGGNPDTKLDRWIIVEATKQLAKQRANKHDVRLFINLTPAVFNDDALLPWLNVALKAADLPAHALIFQFRETDIENNLKAAKNTISGFHDIGSKISITHFGRSPESIKTLKFVNADFVRTDGTLTQELQTNSSGTTILKGIVSSVHEAEKQAIIPLVENASVLALLWQIGAEYMQGNFLQPPQREMNYEFADIA